MKSDQTELDKTTDYEGIDEFKEWVKSTPTEKIDLIIELTEIYNILESLYIQSMLDNISKGKNEIGMKEVRIARLMMNTLVLIHKVKNKPKKRKVTYEDIINSFRNK